jgi:quercetin dioxygenase-like cupin family protein
MSGPWAASSPRQNRILAMTITRVPLASHDIEPVLPLTRIRVVRLEFRPGQETGLHFHPMPVMGYVAEGAFIVQVEDGEVRRYQTGEIVLEPANTRITRFDNASSSEPAALIATYLGGEADDKLIEFLEHQDSKV